MPCAVFKRDLFLTFADRLKPRVAAKDFCDENKRGPTVGDIP